MGIVQLIRDAETAYKGFTAIIRFGLDAKAANINSDDLRKDYCTERLETYRALHDEQRSALASASLLATIPAYVAVRVFHRDKYHTAREYLAGTFDRYLPSPTAMAVDASGKTSKRKERKLN